MGAWRTAIGHSSTFAGQWANGGKGVRDRYLGLRFIIKGQVHYGWVRLNVSFKNGEFSGLLTGYAYETIPNKAIATGKTKGTVESHISHRTHSRTCHLRPTRAGIARTIHLAAGEVVNATQRTPDTAASFMALRGEQRKNESRAQTI
jgi:hypothetical protein